MKPARVARIPTPSRRATAFTLLQLLVVMGIIAVLLATLLPAIGRAREHANSVQCQSNLHQLSLAMLMYVSANGGWFPATAGLYTPSYNDWVCWQPTRDLNSSAIRPYLDSMAGGAILRCPSDDWMSRTTNPNPAYPPYPFSYSMNEWLSPGPTSLPLELPALPLAAINNSAGKIMFVDESGQTIDDGNWSPEGSNWLAIRHDSPGIQPDAAPYAGYPIPNATRRGNVVFLDGHTDFVPRNFAHNPAQFDPHE